MGKTEGLNSVLASYVILLLVYTSCHVSAVEGCCAPPQWEVQALEGNSIGNVHHHIYYDATNQLVRWDRYGNLESSDEIVDLHTYSIYQKGIEFLFYPALNTCLVHYPDQFFGWCYGPSVGQSFVANITLAGGACTMWNTTGNQMTWISQNMNCWPVSMVHLSDSYTFFNPVLGIADYANVFAIPSICVVPPSVKLEISKSSLRSVFFK